MIKAGLLLLVCLALSVQARPVEEETWSFLLLAQFWPATSCVYFDEKKCVPQVVKGWTIHGLWPSRNGTEQPENCNKSLVFNKAEIQSLQSNLSVQWPYYNNSQEADPSDLWKHEWEKHGTCAYSLETIRGELKYFSKALELHKPLNTFEVLKNANITPSTTQRYKPQDIFDAVRNHYGTIPNVGCYYDKKTHMHYFDQVWLCFTKDFKPQDCAPATYGAKPGIDTSLQFKSERSGSSQLEAHKDPNYYVDCDLKKEINYLPLPYKKDTTVVEILEESYLSYRWP